MNSHSSEKTKTLISLNDAIFAFCIVASGIYNNLVDVDTKEMLTAYHYSGTDIYKRINKCRYSSYGDGYLIIDTAEEYDRFHKWLTQ